MFFNNAIFVCFQVH